MSSPNFPKNHGVLWCVDEDTKLLQHIMNKNTIENIASIHQRTQSSIKARLHDHIRNLKLLCPDINPQDIVNVFNMDLDEVNYLLSNNIDITNSIRKHFTTIASYEFLQLNKKSYETQPEIKTNNTPKTTSNVLSYSNISLCKNITDVIGKRILAIDIETTGLPERVAYDVYHNPKKIQFYEKARCIEIAWSYIENYDGQVNTQVNSYICIPKDLIEDIFTPKVIQINNLPYDKVINEGTTFRKIMKDYGFLSLLENTDFIVGHNPLFDVSILASELHRDDLSDYAEKLVNIPLLDTMIFGKDICCIPSYNNRYKNPSLTELHRHYYNEEPINVHSAGGDVLTLLKCLTHMIC